MVTAPVFGRVAASVFRAFAIIFSFHVWLGVWLFFCAVCCGVYCFQFLVICFFVDISKSVVSVYGECGGFLRGCIFSVKRADDSEKDDESERTKYGVDGLFACHGLNVGFNTLLAKF